MYQRVKAICWIRGCLEATDRKRHSFWPCKTTAVWFGPSKRRAGIWLNHPGVTKKSPTPFEGGFPKFLNILTRGGSSPVTCRRENLVLDQIGRYSIVLKAITFPSSRKTSLWDILSLLSKDVPNQDPQIAIYGLVSTHLVYQLLQKYR